MLILACSALAKKNLRQSVDQENGAMRRRLAVPMFLLYAASLALGAYGAFHDWPWQ